MAAEHEVVLQSKYITMLMNPPNETWEFVLRQVQQDPKVLAQP